MKKIKVISFLVISLFLFATISPVLAGTMSCATGQLCDPLGTNGDFTQAANNIIKYILGLVGVFALIAFVWGGIEWMISGGDSKKIQKGKDMMIWAVYGMVFIFGSYAIVNMVLKALGA